MPRQDHNHFHAVYIYDFTFIRANEPLLPVDDFVKLLRPLFKKWCFQLEKAPTTGTLHYQGRGSLFKKLRHAALCSLLNDTPLRGMDVSESSNESKTNDMFYTLKYDTRVEGPWSDVTYKVPEYIPRQYRGLMDRLHPWQQQVYDTRHEFNDRVINLVCDTNGNHGKSTLAALCQLYDNALDLPPIGDHKELLQIVCDVLMAKQERSPCIVFIDLPRALTLDPKKLSPFMVAVEQIKKGHVCDVRHHYKEWWFDSPQLWVFCNHPINPNYMSKDRWRFYGITPMNTLADISHKDMSDMFQDSVPNVPTSQK